MLCLGSSVPRLISANLTLDVHYQNISLVLHSARGSILAKGKFKNTPRDKYLEAVLDINNRKHLDLSMSLEEVQSHNGRTYIPKFYLGVNSERVAELDGMHLPCRDPIFLCVILRISEVGIQERCVAVGRRSEIPN